MLVLIRNGEVYAPDFLGKKDILIVNDKIGFIEDTIDIPEGFFSDKIKIIEAAGKRVFPGFIDSHVHIIGGGGEGGYKTRTPELKLTDATLSGITTVIGVIGTDGTTRTMASLVAKARGLDEEGITCYVQTGSYQVPVRTLTGKIEDDILLVDKIIGTGEIAIADHRSSQPSAEEFARIASQSRVGGILSGKSGVVNVHLGDSRDCLKLIYDVIENTDIPIKQFYPTHINRNPYLFEEGIEFGLKGGYVDFTTSTIPQFLEDGEVECGKGLKRMLEAGVPEENITFTSDGQGSLPEFDKNGEFKGLKVAHVSSLFNAVRKAVLEDGVPLETAIKVITSNPAKILKLTGKGSLAEGKDADVVLVDKETLKIDTVLARGKLMVENREAVVKGTFE
ncbi:beta-aspartyl-peptidase [Rossellomorea vietnamensis]|uniref:Isoaspartyl dipeptidase n=1 Tax=Rossellomorea vietnamensis TaxID=218284 RepID=A0A5D4KKK9_9BACI|nr:beta-aspartyl-peptidase [Rossellomorea vietnamensis]TYR77430.1 beta-aspartyl-peptidase [Rossellomorea vietnamensis]